MFQNLLSRANFLFRQIAAVLIISNCCLSTGVAGANENTGESDPSNQKQVERGQFIYTRFCSVCHGANLEGQPNWRIRNSDGKLPAPPHDETGHTWHHADSLLFSIIKDGLVPPNAPENYKTDMPAWKDTLKDNDIWAVLSYIKSRWPKETQEIQQDINAKSKNNK